MSGSGGREKINLDLTASDQRHERVPTARADLQADVTVKVGPLFEADLSVQDNAGLLGTALNLLILTFATTLAPLCGLALCLTANVPVGETMLVFVGLCAMCMWIVAHRKGGMDKAGKSVPRHAKRRGHP